MLELHFLRYAQIFGVWLGLKYWQAIPIKFIDSHQPAHILWKHLLLIIHYLALECPESTTRKCCNNCFDRMEVYVANLMSNATRIMTTRPLPGVPMVVI